MATRVWKLFVLFSLLVGLPLLGVWVHGLPVHRYLVFPPPKAEYIDHAPFSWKAFCLYSLLIFSLTFPLAWRWIRSGRGAKKGGGGQQGRLPWWGYLGVVTGASAWILAWTRLEWFSPWQLHTFTPLWCSFILVVNAISQKRGGKCFMLKRPRLFLLLFPASSVFWWFFEYLNRFVQNWHYLGGEVSAGQYLLYGSISFSTVLPAVLSTKELLLTFPSLNQAFSGFVRAPWINHPLLGAILLLSASASLFFIGVCPNYLFPMLWVAPLLMITGLQILGREPHVFAAISRGDWRDVVSAAFAALLCGWFWEMWNYCSLAKWEYSVPFVQRFHLFEMPLLGYAGYLPFGLECYAVAGLVEGFLAEKSL